MEIRNDVTHIYVVDRDGKKLWEGSCESTPEVIGEMLKKQAPDAVKIGLETCLCVPRLAVANSILTRVKNPSSLQVLGFHITKRSGMKKARIAVARKCLVPDSSGICYSESMGAKLWDIYTTLTPAVLWLWGASATRNTRV